jgi:hypothetical protein
LVPLLLEEAHPAKAHLPFDRPTQTVTIQIERSRVVNEFTTVDVFAGQGVVIAVEHCRERSKGLTIVDSFFFFFF